MIDVFLCLGSNVDKAKNITAALQALGQNLGQLTLSPFYQSQAVEGGNNSYINMAIGLVTDLSLEELKSTIKKIEDELDRDRSNPTIVSVDIDIALYGDVVRNENEITLPHPDILQYPHALLPLADIVGDYIHPVTQRSLNELVRQCDISGIEKIESLAAV